MYTTRKKIFFVESNVVSYCPSCGEALQYRDSCNRILLKAGRERRTLRIRRLQCPKCRRIHRELPDCLVPFKHYETQVISGFLDGVVTPDDEISEDYPSEGTMKRWSHWLKANSPRIEGYLRTFGSLLSDLKELLNSDAALLLILRSSTPQWLEWITRIIYNSGGFLVPVY